MTLEYILSSLGIEGGFTQLGLHSHFPFDSLLRSMSEPLSGWNYDTLLEDDSNESYFYYSSTKEYPL